MKRRLLRKKKKTIAPILRGILATALFLVFVTLVSSFSAEIQRSVHQGWGWIEKHPYFSVHEIKVIGGKKIQAAEIVKRSGLTDGMNIWKVDPKSIEKSLKEHPWIKHVLVRREFPDRVLIQIKERVARGIVVMGKLYYVDADGVLFKEVQKGEQKDLPFFTGLSKKDLVKHAHSIRLKIWEALKLADLFGSSSFGLSEIHFSPRGDVVVYSTGHPLSFHMGWGEWKKKVHRLELVLAEWKNKENHLKTLDLSLRNQVVIRLREPFRRAGKEM